MLHPVQTIAPAGGAAPFVEYARTLRQLAIRGSAPVQNLRDVIVVPP